MKSIRLDPTIEQVCYCACAFSRLRLSRLSEVLPQCFSTGEGRYSISAWYHLLLVAIVSVLFRHM